LVKPKAFEVKKEQKATQSKFQDNPEQRKKDLSDMVEHDFEEAEEPPKATK